MDIIEKLEGQLQAVQLLLWDAVRLLSEDQASELERQQFAHVDGYRAQWGEGDSEQRAAFIDETERLALLLRNRFRFIERDGPCSGEFVVACLQCKTFPIGPRDAKCPVCDTGKWLHVVRI